MILKRVECIHDLPRWQQPEWRHCILLQTADRPDRWTAPTAAHTIHKEPNTNTQTNKQTENTSVSYWSVSPDPIKLNNRHHFHWTQTGLGWVNWVGHISKWVESLSLMINLPFCQIIDYLLTHLCCCFPNWQLKLFSSASMKTHSGSVSLRIRRAAAHSLHKSCQPFNHSLSHLNTMINVPLFCISVNSEVHINNGKQSLSIPWF